MYDQDGSSSEDNSLEDCAGRSCSSTEWTHTYHLFRISLQRAAMGPMGTGMHQHFDIMPDKICRFQTMKNPVRCLSMPLPISGSFACSFLSFNIFQQDLANKSALRRSTGTSSIANFSSLIDRWTKCCSKCVCVCQNSTVCRHSEDQNQWDLIFRVFQQMIKRWNIRHLAWTSLAGWEAEYLHSQSLWG